MSIHFLNISSIGIRFLRNSFFKQVPKSQSDHVKKIHLFLPGVSEKSRLYKIVIFFSHSLNKAKQRSKETPLLTST